MRSTTDSERRREKNEKTEDFPSLDGRVRMRKEQRHRD